MPEENTGANPQGATENISFRERMRERLAAERVSEEPAGPPEGYDDPAVNPSEEPSDNVPVGEGYEEALDPARQPEEEVASEPEGPTDVTEPEEAVAETSDDDADPDAGMPADVRELTERAEKAEERAQMMERDYRIKTHKIAAATRDLESHSEVVQQQAQFILGLAEQGVTQFDSVNWDQLRTQPEQYQQTRQAYDAACQTRDMLKKNLSGIADQHKQLLETAKSREAEVSMDILKTTVEGWNNELYGKLRAFAVEELSYTEGEFDDITDWRRMRDIHAQFQMSQTTKDVLRLHRKKAKQPVKRQREQPAPKQRNAQGQFQTARAAFHDRPGDPEARRNFFQEKLRAERYRR